MIWKHSSDEKDWGFIVRPKDISFLFETNLLAIESGINITGMKALQKKNGFASLNAFLIDSIRKKEIRLVEPRYRNAIADTFLYSEVPSILWSIEDEKLVSTRGKATVPYFIYKSDEGFRFICASDYTKDTFTYNPLSANADGDLTWYDGKSKEKLVTKNFNGMCLATVIRNSEFPKFLKNKS
jgi:hypothetical protein